MRECIAYVPCSRAQKNLVLAFLLQWSADTVCPLKRAVQLVLCKCFLKLNIVTTKLGVSLQLPLFWLVFGDPESVRLGIGVSLFGIIGWHSGRFGKNLQKEGREGTVSVVVVKAVTTGDGEGTVSSVSVKTVTIGTRSFVSCGRGCVLTRRSCGIDSSAMWITKSVFTEEQGRIVPSCLMTRALSLIMFSSDHCAAIVSTLNTCQPLSAEEILFTLANWLQLLLDLWEM